MNRSNLIRCGATAVLLASSSGARAQEQALVVSLLWAIAVGYLLWVVVVGLVVRKATWRPRGKWVAALLLVGAPWLIVLKMTLDYKAGAVRLQAQMSESTRVLAQATSYFDKMCATQRQVPAVVSVPGRAGLYLPPIATDTLALEGALQDQYKAPVYWVAQPREVNSRPDHEFAFIEIVRSPANTKGRLVADALPTWWNEEGLLRADEAEQPQPLRELLAKTFTRRVTWTLSDPTDRARYMLELDDISTQEDRDHWVARGRIRLTDRREGRVVAEYVGFSLNRFPGPHDTFSYAWEHTRQCPGPEQNYESATGTWHAIDFFLEQFVRIE